MSKKPTVLMILDGYGLNDKTEGNAVAIQLGLHAVVKALAGRGQNHLPAGTAEELVAELLLN